MKLRYAIAAVIALGTAVVWANEPVDHATTVKQLKERASATAERDRAKVLADLVREEVELANDQFTAGNVDQAQATVADIRKNVSDCRARAIDGGKDLKRIEILLREAARRLEDVRRSLAFEDQGPLKEAVVEIQDARADILDRMFAPKESHK